MKSASLLGGLLLSFGAWAADSSAPASGHTWDATPGLDGTPVKVERRLLVKERRLFFAAGASVLERHDYYGYPGLTFATAFYLTEELAAEFRYSLLMPFVTPGAQEVFDRSRMVPNAQRVGSILGGGARWSLGYGKVALRPVLQTVVHFDIQVTGHAALAFTDRAVNPTLLAGPALLVRFSNWVFALAEVQFSAGYEVREKSLPVAFGVMPTVAVGIAPW